jgi:hypothetical protein
VKRLAFTIVAIAIAGCASQPVAVQPPRPMIAAPVEPAPVPTFGSWDGSDITWYKVNDKGPNIVRGSAFLRQRGGGIVTCAGLHAFLHPAGKYAKAWVANTYGSEAGGYLDNNVKVAEAPLPDPEFNKLGVKTPCDAQGAFQFLGLADGEYYVQAQVFWESPGRYGMQRNGGMLAKKVSLAGGVASQIILTAN